MPSMDSLIDLIWPRKSSLCLKKCQQKLPKLKGRGKNKNKKTEQNIQEYGTIAKVGSYTQWNYQEKKE